MKRNAFGLDENSLPAAPKSHVMAARKLLLAGQADPLIKKAIEIALDDEHPQQVTALKMCMDRLLPMNEFEQRKDGSRTAITITISGVNDKPVIEGNNEDVEEV
jgi:hypothetical protein